MFRHVARPGRALSMSVVAFTAATLLSAPAVEATAAAPIQQQAQSITPVVGGAAPARATATRLVAGYHPAAPRWPAVGEATVALPTTRAAAPVGYAPGGASPTVRARAGTLPVYLSAAPGPVSGLSNVVGSGATDSQFIVSIVDYESARAAGEPLLVRVRPASSDSSSRSSSAAVASRVVALTVDYSSFASAFGADWAARLRLAQLPSACSSPAAAGCRPAPLPTTNDGSAVTAMVAVPAAGAVVALDAGASSGDGDFTATPLKPSGMWSAGGNSGGFSWSYDLRTPPSLGGPAPAVALSYSSQAVDGEMAASNNQPSWIGDGFAYNPGEVSRGYVGCAQDMGSGANNATATGDECWKTDNATLTLNGRTSELLYNASDHQWHMRSETGWRVQRLTGASNGDNDGEYWVVTTTDGTQYYFGLNRLSGYTGTAPANKVTSSVFTVPVYGNNAGEPCHQSTYAASSCAQGWQWNLDYVVDPHGNTASFWYTPQGNRYGASGVTYTRGGFLAHIDYGTTNRGGTDTDETATAAPMTVVFSPDNRCLSGCATHDASHWPDTPWDLACTTLSCSSGSPSFWIDQRLRTVRTRVWSATVSAYRDVEMWTFTHSFPDPGDGTRAGLWLSSIAHSGLVGGTATVPAIAFQPTAMNNRVDTALKNGLRPMNWPRLTEIDTETGEKIFVTYSAPECSGSNLPSAPDQNTKRCYPVRWTPPDLGTEILDYFHKYVVTKVEEFDATDTTPGPQSTVTTYTYVGAPGWHYADDDGLTQAKYRTWNQWRGYATVRTSVGAGTEQTMTKSLYFRGMDGDKLSAGTRSATVTDSKGLAVLPDADQYAGLTRETTVYNGPTGPAISGTVNDPWTSGATATRTLDGTTVAARFVNVADAHSWVALDQSRPDRWTDTHTDFDATYALPTAVTDNGDTARTGDEVCTLTDYVRNTGSGIVATVSELRRYAMTCAAARIPGKVFTTADIISDERTSYDGQAWGAPPTKGDATRTETLKDWRNNTGTFLTVATSVRDAYGRTVDAVDADGMHTATAYTPATGGPVTRTVTTNGTTGWTDTTDLEPAWGLTLGVTDPNSRRTDLSYDPLGRLTGLWLPGRSKATYPSAPNTSYAYTISATAPSVVTTRKLNPNGAYNTTDTLYDALLRTRQVQAEEAGTGGGRIVTDTFSDSAGRVYLTWGPYLAAGAPAGALFWPSSGSDTIDRWSKSIYDGAGRPVELDTNSTTSQLWHSTTAYGGDRSDVTPPAGGVATSTVTDAHGRTVELRQYHGAVATGSTDPATYDATSYTYNGKGQLATLRNPAGTTWTYGYDLRGQRTSVVDPDAGTTTTTYDDGGRVLSTTDGRGVTLAYAYADPLHRKTGEYLTSISGPRLTGFAYDQVTNGRGMLTTTSRYDGSGNAYTSAVTALDAAGRQTATTVAIPTAESGLGGSYAYNTSYNPDGSVHSLRIPAIGGSGGLSVETLTYGYQNLGLPTTLATTLGNTYVVSTSYTSLGQTGTITLANSGGQSVQIGDYWDDRTGRLARIWTTREATPSSVSDLNVFYDNAGNITRTVQAATVAGAETQCYQDNYLNQLIQAWTPSSGSCAAPPTPGAIGGSPAPYWTSWQFDSAGLRRQQSEHGTAHGDRVTTYAYPAPTAAGADELTSTSSTDSSGTTTGTYGYVDAGGHNNGLTISRPGPGGTQTLSWDSENRVATIADSSGQSSYLYDASGNQLIEKDPAGKTLFLPGQELRVSPGGTLVTATRFYGHGARTVAQRTPTGVTWLADDQQGTATIAISATPGQAATVRRFTPYGAPRGINPTWPSDRGYVSGTEETVGLTNEGARQYDAGTGRFLSPDPMFHQDQPQSWNGYTYATADPVDQSDATGLDPCPDGGGGCHYDGTDPHWEMYIPKGAPTTVSPTSSANAAEHTADTVNGARALFNNLYRWRKVQLMKAKYGAKDPSNPIEYKEPVCKADPVLCAGAVNDLNLGEDPDDVQHWIDCNGMTDSCQQAQFSIGACLAVSGAVGRFAVGAEVCGVYFPATHEIASVFSKTVTVDGIGLGISTAAYVQITDATKPKDLCGPFTGATGTSTPLSIGVGSGGGVHTLNIGAGEGDSLAWTPSDTVVVIVHGENVCQ